MSSELFIGVMSGTSLDGVDAVLAECPPPGTAALPRTLDLVHVDYPDDLHGRLLDLCRGAPAPVAEVGAADLRVAQVYAVAVHKLLRKSAMAASAVRAVGAHGQTVHHEPRGELRYTMQLGDPNTLAVLTGIPVVADFRRRDMALGGQGAPLAPGFHDIALRHPTRTRVVLNCGGIANISVLVPGQPCIGYDTGPANILMDGWIQAHKGLRFDADGAWAAQGQVNATLLASMLSHSYFARPAPKSTGRELFNDDWVSARARSFGSPACSDVDVQRTLLELTAASVAQAVEGHAESGDLLVCGGGAYNGLLLQRLAALMPAWQVASTAQVGIAPDAMEALAFAVFAQRTVHGLPGNLPAVTGASRPCVLGALYVP